MRFKILLSALVIFIATTTATAQKYESTSVQAATKKYKEVVFSSEKSLAENLSLSEDFSYIANSLNDEQFANELSTSEMITVFVVRDKSFTDMPEETRDSIVGNKSLMEDMLKLNVIPGRVDSNALLDGIQRNNGTVYYTTLSNEKIGFRKDNGKVVMFDHNNNTAIVTDTDYLHSKGYFHIVDGLLFPASKK